MEFWDTFWATMWGALGGAVVAAFAAWLFSLDLRRREREDRKQEREQDRLDRVAERDDDRLNRAAERDDERHFRIAEQEQQHQQRYEAEVMREWPRVADELMEYANANRAVMEAGMTARAGEAAERYRRSVASMMSCFHGVAIVAQKSDHEIVNNLGVMVATLRPSQKETIEIVDQIRILLSSYMTAHPDFRADRKDALRKKLLFVTGMKPES